jgi:TolA-binding protein
MSADASRLLHRGLWIGLLAGALAGCQHQSSSPSAGATGNASVNKGGSPPSDPATDMLRSAMFQLQPENLGIDSDPDAAISVLNSWREQTSLIEVERYGFTAESLQALPHTLLSAEQRRRMLATEFSRDDATYIRNALLAAQMSRYATEGKTAELDRIVALFEFAMRTVTLQPSMVPQLPFGWYEILVLGQGTADDRAWVFATLLKQQRIDAVVLQSKDDPEARLVGVILDGETFLFDTKLGLPIPRGEDPPGVRISRPATLKEMQAHPEWWQGLTVRADQPYPWNSDQLAAADVFVISAEESWGGRMKQLETVLPSDSLCVLYDPLVETPALPPLTARIAAGHAAWTPDTLRFWSHPLNVAERFASMGQQAAQLMFLLERFNVPIEIKEVEKTVVNETTKKPEVVKGLEARPLRQHLKCRMEQLQGKFADATAHFLGIRHLAVESLPAELAGNPQVLQQVRQMYALAASDASYWSAVCKRELGDLTTAAGALEDYRRRYPRSDWTSAAGYLLALVRAERGELSEARAAISSLAADDPHRPGLDVLLKRWEGLADAK